MVPLPHYPHFNNRYEYILIDDDFNKIYPSCKGLECDNDSIAFTCEDYVDTFKKWNIFSMCTFNHSGDLIKAIVFKLKQLYNFNGCKYTFKLIEYKEFFSFDENGIGNLGDYEPHLRSLIRDIKINKILE